jgi:hypothetical protein
MLAADGMWMQIFGGCPGHEIEDYQVTCVKNRSEF